MTRSTLKLIFIAALVAAPASVFAEVIIQVRCTTDSLDIPQALQRLEWARKCGLTLNTGSVPNTGDPANFFESTLSGDLAAAPDFRGAKEYRENTPNRAFSGNVNDYNINYYYSFARYNRFFYNVFQETSGPTINFWKWSNPMPRARPLYPAFDSTPDGMGTELSPHPALANCNLYTDPNGINQWPSGNNFFLFAYCTGGCYTPDQSLRFGSGDANILDAFQARRDDIVTLSPDATLGDPRTQVSRVYSYT